MRRIVLLNLVLIPLILIVALPFIAARPPANQSASLIPLDVNLPSDSTGTPGGTLALRVYTPRPGHARYADGAPVVIWLPGGAESNKGLWHGLPDAADDIVVITFVFPGGQDPASGRVSAGVYDNRGLNCIAALRDVILYAAGERADSLGHTIDDLLPVPVLHDNIGLIGISNGGNIVIAAPALHGSDFAANLRYVIQWESPVSSQIATRDLGRVWLKPSAAQGDYVNLRYTGYGPLVLAVAYDDLAHDPADTYYPVFLDGNGNGTYDTVEHPVTHHQVPDVNLDGILDLNEDFPLDTYPDIGKQVYSRPVSHALAHNDVFATWPISIATPAEAGAYWDIREAVRMYDEVLADVPDLEGMVLAGVVDHVQSAPDKPHIRQAFDGWNANGAWVQINASPAYLIEADPALASRTDLPNNAPNIAPGDWSDVQAYCVPEDIYDRISQLAAIWQMADRAHAAVMPTATPTATASPTASAVPRRAFLPVIMRK